MNRGIFTVACAFCGLVASEGLVRADQNIVISSSTQFSETPHDPLSSNTTETMTVRGTGTVFTFDGVWNNGTGTSKTYWKLEDDARINVTGEARINDNMPDLINARPFYVTGTGTIEFQAAFDADHTGYLSGMTAAANVTAHGGDGSWANDGFSTINFGGDVTIVTNASQNLTSIHKLGTDAGGSLAHTHHGLITISEGDGATWVVQSADQAYDGGINWSSDWTLRTVTDLSFTGVYEPEAKVAFGSRGPNPATLTKEGDGALNIEGTQLYAPGTEIVVAAGTVNFHTDPSDYGPWYQTWHWPVNKADADGGQTLALTVEAGGTATFLAPTSGLRSLTSEGSISICLGSADVTGVKVDVLTALEAGGDLVIHDDGTLGVGMYDLFDAVSLTGSFDLNLPAGINGTYDSSNGVLTITQVPEPATLLLLTMAALAAILPRRTVCSRRLTT